MQEWFSETVTGVWYALLAHFLFVCPHLLWNRFRRPELTLLVIPHPKPIDAIVKGPARQRPQVVEVRIKVSAEGKAGGKGSATNVRQRPAKGKASSQLHPKVERVDCLSVCPNCGHSQGSENVRKLKDIRSKVSRPPKGSGMGGD